MNETLDKFNRIDNWIKSERENYNPLNLDDVGREGVVVDMDLVDTKYGSKLVIVIDFGDETKICFLSRTYAKSFLKGRDVKGSIGQKVKIVNFMVQTPTGVKEKAFPVFV